MPSRIMASISDWAARSALSLSYSSSTPSERSRLPILASATRASISARATRISAPWALMPAAMRSGQPARQKRSIHGVICARYFGRMVSGPSGSLSHLGSLRSTSLVASGMMSENANAPALPRLVSSAMPLRSTSSTERPASTSFMALARPTMPAPTMTTSASTLGSGHQLELRARVDRVLYDRRDLLALFAFERETRRAHPLAAFAGHLVGELDVLD